MMQQKNSTDNNDPADIRHDSTDLEQSHFEVVPKPKFTREICFMGLIYILLQAFLLLLTIDPFIDYYNNIVWGIKYNKGLYPYKDFTSNEYPVLSVWGWIIAYNLSPTKSYYCLSVAMNLPYWILAALGGFCFYQLLNRYGVEDHAAFGLSCLFLFMPMNIIDTFNNHGSLGTASTIIIAIYFWHQKKYFTSAAFIAAGFSIKLFPIYIAPFLIWSLQTYQQRFKYSVYLGLWIIFFHLPVIFILPDYFDALVWRTSHRGGVSYGAVVGVIGDFIGINQLVTLVWLFGLFLCTIILLHEDNLNIFEKFALVMMTNNLLEFQGGIGHITVVLPYMAVYYLVITTNQREKQFYWLYLVIGTIWAFDRLLFKLREISDYIGVSYMGFMIFMTTLLFLFYVRGLTRIGKLQWSLPLEFWNRVQKVIATLDLS